MAQGACPRSNHRLTGTCTRRRGARSLAQRVAHHKLHTAQQQRSLVTIVLSACATALLQQTGLPYAHTASGCLHAAALAQPGPRRPCKTRGALPCGARQRLRLDKTLRLAGSAAIPPGRAARLVLTAPKAARRSYPGGARWRGLAPASAPACPCRAPCPVRRTQRARCTPPGVRGWACSAPGPLPGATPTGRTPQPPSRTRAGVGVATTDGDDSW